MGYMLLLTGDALNFKPEATFYMLKHQKLEAQVKNERAS